MGNKVVTLKYETYLSVAVVVPIAVLETLGTLAVDKQIAVRVTVQTADDVQQRRLAAAARSQYGYELALAKVERYVPEGVYGKLVRYRVILVDIF